MERPQGANVAGRGDFITARVSPDGQIEIVVTDVKSRTSATSAFPPQADSMPVAWGQQIRDAISPARLNLNNPALEQQIRAAYTDGRVAFRQVNVDYSTAGGGRMTWLPVKR